MAARDSDLKKDDYENTYLENKTTSNTLSSDDGILSSWSLGEQSRILRRVDVCLIPVCRVTYCVSLLDMTNLSNAAIAE
jgi:hypothetical protein